MFKSKLCGFAIALMIGSVGISPAHAYAAETNTETTELSQKDSSQKDNRAAFDEAMQKATDKWNKLTDKQKAEVYALLETEMKDEFKLMDKLVEFGVFGKEDAAFIKTRMQQKFDELQKNGEFPLARPKREKRQ